MRGKVRGWRRWAVIAALLTVVVACGEDDEGAGPATPAETGGRFACLDFEATVTAGPGTGKSWTGDLVLTPDSTGAFTGVLVPPSEVDRRTLRVRDRSKAICRAVGQQNGAQVSWFLYCRGNERIFGIGQITPVGRGQELRGIVQGPADNDFGIYHGRNYPPYIRIISPD